MAPGNSVPPGQVRLFTGTNVRGLRPLERSQLPSTCLRSSSGSVPIQHPKSVGFRFGGWVPEGIEHGTAIKVVMIRYIAGGTGLSNLGIFRRPPTKKAGTRYFTGVPGLHRMGSNFLKVERRSIELAMELSINKEYWRDQLPEEKVCGTQNVRNYSASLWTSSHVFGLGADSGHELRRQGIFSHTWLPKPQGAPNPLTLFGH